MFVIDRSVDEAILVGNTVVRVLEVRYGEVRLAISSTDSSDYREVVLQCQAGEEESLFAVKREGSLSF